MIAQVVPVLLAFGANLGDRGETIAAAQRELAETAGITGLRASPLRETIALTEAGPDPDAPRYLNGVAIAETTLGPHELLDALQAAEARHGRVRVARWGDRTLDIDLILYGGRVIQDERLTVPHPRAHERDFVLAPWLDLDPDAVLMGHGRVADLLARLGDSTRPFEAAASGGAELGAAEPAATPAAVPETADPAGADHV
ncbi:MAG: 2-amino-4-hydroxy-6-hydroxymethyldihydropteridine diphosphokinase [Candidatus Leucobacter sulfamidivorax]|nr:2-amino-4-hydroxy-6-hydroxymethyldihydropteridine diphosphokinase [Candidatus Leucobacter sulfamidivorax]